MMLKAKKDWQKWIVHGCRKYGRPRGRQNQSGFAVVVVSVIVIVEQLRRFAPPKRAHSRPELSAQRTNRFTLVRASSLATPQ